MSGDMIDWRRYTHQDLNSSYYFDPHLDIQTKIGIDIYGIPYCIRIGYFEEGKVKLINNLDSAF